MKQFIIFCGLVCYFRIISGQLDTTDENAYCYQFTWLGPKYENASKVNMTCEHLKSNPCVEPFVATTHSLPPNTTWMWQNLNRSEITCPLTSGVCIKFSYTYNNIVLNTTYFCGKMIEDQSNPVDSGCYTHTVNGHIIQACACKSVRGFQPCNSSSRINYSLSIILILMYLLFII